MVFSWRPIALSPWSPNMPQNKTTRHTIQSIDRAIAILELLAREPEGIPLSHLAKNLGLHAQTVQSLLRTLQTNDMVVQDRARSPYVLGPLVHQMSRCWTSRYARGTMAIQYIADLADRLQEYVLLAELRGHAVIPIADANWHKSLKVMGGVEPSKRLHTMATGKLLLAYIDEERRRSLMASLDLGGQGHYLPTTIKQLTSELAAIRRQGYATCRENAHPHVSAIAVPVYDEARHIVLAALGTSMLTTRLPAVREDEIIRELRAAAVEIAQLWSSFYDRYDQPNS